MGGAVANKRMAFVIEHTLIDLYYNSILGVWLLFPVRRQRKEGRGEERNENTSEKERDLVLQIKGWSQSTYFQRMDQNGAKKLWGNMITLLEEESANLSDCYIKKTPCFFFCHL